MTKQRFTQITALIASLFLSLLLLATNADRRLVNAGLASADTAHALQKTLRAEREAAAATEAKRARARLQSKLLQIPPPVINAHAYMVATSDTDTPLLALREDKVLPIASITKLVTALAATEILGSDDIVTVTATAKTAEEKTSLAAIGEQFRRDTALRLMLALSANDIAMAVAEAAGRALGATTSDTALHAFVSSMNRTARSIGLANTEFFNPTGLDGEMPEKCRVYADSSHAREHLAAVRCPTATRPNVSTARDLTILAKYLIKNRTELLALAGERTDIVMSESGLRYEAVSTNELLEDFPELVSGKTGYTDEAGETLILVSRNNSTLGTNVIVLLRSTNRFEDGANLLYWLRAFNR